MVNDFSRYTELYLIAHKLEVFQHIKGYIEAIQTKFNKKPKILRLSWKGMLIIP